MGGGIDGSGEMEKCRHSYILYMYICIYICLVMSMLGVGDYCLLQM